MYDRPRSFGGEPATDPALLRTLAAAGLPATGRFLSNAGWVSRVWVGEEYVVRLPGRTLYAAWPTADSHTRHRMIESLGAALRALHRVPAPVDLLPPWLAGALSGRPWPAFHPPVVSAALQQVAAAQRLPGHDAGLLADVAEWIQERLALFAPDEPVLVHGDLHGSNVIVDQGRVTGLIDFAEALAQPADVELDTILRWCATAT